MSRHVLTAVMLLWLTFLVIVPLGAVGWSAFENGPGPFFQALNNPSARHAFGLTLGITTLAVVINTLFGVILALVLSRQRFRGRLILEELTSLPLAVSPVVAGFMFIILFGKTGWLGRWFEAGGIQIIYALPGMILATIFVTLPFTAKELIPILRELGTDQEDAARTLGASPRQIFFRVTLPSVRWALAYGITLTTARALGEFGAVLVVSGSVIGRTQTATLFIHQEFTDFHYQGAFSASVALAAISFCMLVIMELLKRRIEIRKD